MSRMTSEYPERVYSSSEEGRRRSLAEQSGSRSASPNLLIAGLAVVGLGALAWYYFGSDLKRYLKIRDM